MKRALPLILVFVLCLSLCACGGSSNVSETTETISKTPTPEASIATAPENQMILADLQNSLRQNHMDAYGYEVTMHDFSVVKSKTEDDLYTAELSVLAESQFAEFSYIANVEYTKYDQGWLMDSCTWELSNHTVTKYPDETLRTSLLSAQGLADLDDVEFITEGNTIICRGSMNKDLNVYLDIKSEIQAVWTYDLYSNSWILEDSLDEKCTFAFNERLEGEHNLEKMYGSGTMTISNVYDRGFDLQITTDRYTTETFSVWVDSESWDIDDNAFLSLYLVNPVVQYNGESTGDFYISVTFYTDMHMYYDTPNMMSGHSYTSRWFMYLDNSSYISTAYLG